MQLPLVLSDPCWHCGQSGVRAPFILQPKIVDIPLFSNQILLFLGRNLLCLIRCRCFIISKNSVMDDINLLMVNTLSIS